MKRNYVGMANSFHDSALAIVDSAGEIVFAEATERYLQYKRTIGVASDVYVRAADLISRYCDPEAELVIASSWSDETKAIMRGNLEKVGETADHYRHLLGDVPAPLCRQLTRQRFYFRSQLSMLDQPGHLLEYELGQTDRWQHTAIARRGFEHHLTHAAAGCYSSPFDEALCAVLDGFGERSSFACFRYENGKLAPIECAPCDGWASLGIFYAMLCETCGFSHLSGEEWKVMGLAAYGRHDDALYTLLREMIQVDGLGIKLAPGTRAASLHAKLHSMRRKPGQPTIEYADLAYAGQRVFSEVLYAFLGNLHAIGFSDNLVLAGGCALNSSANGGILAQTPFQQLHVYCAPADDGNAVGAALLAYHEDHPEARRPPRAMSPYLGSEMSQETLRNLERFGGIAKLAHCAGDAPQRAAALLAQGKIVGWIQGRAEFGPRALGNRSILADPRSASIKETINATVKFREEFRPFAPSILHEYGPTYFHDYQASPYMERTLHFREEIAATVPGVVHADRTGRLQTVDPAWNPGYHALITEFHRLTGVPLVLNTSFNVMGKPIAHSVEDALAVFYTSGLDALFIGDTLLEK